MGSLSRRALLKGSAVAGAASLTSFGFGRLLAQDGGDDPATILNLAATAETFACVHYYSALQNAEALGLSAMEQSWLRAFLDSELQHKLFLEANGAVPLAEEFFVPENLFTDRALFVNTTNTAENWFVAAYLAATRRFAELGEPLLAATASQVSGVESEHQALIRLMGGLQPSFQTLKEPLFWNTSDVVPLFTPFLQGGDGFVGPAGFPGIDAINAATGNDKVVQVTPFIALNGAGTLGTDMDMSTMGAGMMMGDNMDMMPTADPNMAGNDTAAGGDTMAGDNSMADNGDDTAAGNEGGDDSGGDTMTGDTDDGNDDSAVDTLADAVNDAVNDVTGAANDLVGGNNG